MIWVYVYFMWGGCFVCMYASAPHACSTRGGQQRVSNLLELEGRMWAALWVLGINPGSSGSVASTLSCWVISPPSPLLFCLYPYTYLPPTSLYSCSPYLENPNHLFKAKFSCHCLMKICYMTNENWTIFIISMNSYFTTYTHTHTYKITSSIYSTYNFASINIQISWKLCCLCIVYTIISKMLVFSSLTLNICVN